MNTNTSTHKILIIEDNPGDLLLIQDYLDEYFKNYNRVTAKSFSETEKLLGDKGDYFDIILLDLSLPDLDGMALLDAMIQLAKGIPLVILTGYTDIPFSISTLVRGASDYLLKDELTAFSLYKSIIHNIERKKYVLEIERSQKRYTELFQLSPQPLIIYDVDTLTILNVNEASCSLYGYSMDEFIGLSLLDIRPEDEYSYLRKEVEKGKNSTQSSQAYKGMFEHKKKNGAVFTAEIYNNVASHDQQNIRISLVNDVSEKIKYIEEIESQNKRFKDIAWTQSHIVRAPLARIMGLIGLISSENIEVDENEQKYIFKGLIDSAHELDKIILDISQKASSFKNE